MRRTFFIFTLLLSSSHLFAQSGSMTPYFSFDGILKDNLGNPITVSNPVTFGIYDPTGSCLLYEETQTVVPAVTGAFAVFVGSSFPNAKRTGNDRSLEWKTIFQNSTAIANVCSGGTTPYSPVTGDARRLRVTIGGTALTPDFSLAGVPSATTAETLQGKLPGDFLSPNIGANLSQANLESILNGTNYTTLSSLIAGTSSLYAKIDGSNISSPLNLNNQKITNLLTPTASSDAVNKSYADTKIGGSTAAAALSGLSGADNGKVLSWDGTQWVATTASASDSTKLPLAGGAMTGAINMGSNDLSNVGLLSTTGAVNIGAGMSVDTSTLVVDSANNSVGIGTLTPHTSAVLDLAATNKGLLIPRMTNTSIGAIPSPAAGLQVYNTDTNTISFYNGSAWQALGVAGGGVTSLNGLSGPAQTLSFSFAGTSPMWNPTGSDHSLQIPMASMAGVTAGLLSKTDYDSFTNKLSSNLTSGNIFVGSGANLATPYPVTGDLSMTNNGTMTINSGVINNNHITNSTLNLSKIIGSVSDEKLLISDVSGNGLTTLSCAMDRFVQTDISGRPVCSTFSLPNVNGTNGQVLTTNGSGVTSWSSVNVNGTFSNTGNINGLVGSGDLLTLHAATATTPGAVSITAQEFGGPKTFVDQVTFGTAVGSSNIMQTTNGVGIFRNSFTGNPSTLILENLSGTNTGTSMEMRGYSGAVNPLVRLVAAQQTASQGSFVVETHNGSSFTPKLEVRHDGKTSIGLSPLAPSALLNVYSETGGSLASFTADASSTGDVKIQRYNSSQGPKLVFLASQGSLTVPTSTLMNDLLGGIVFRGMNSPSPSTGGASIKAIATEAFGPSTNGTALSFGVTNNGSTAEFEALRINSNGNVGIGINTPDEKLVVFNGSSYGRYTTAGWTHSSDSRLKHDVSDLENSLEKIVQLRGVNYAFNNDPTHKKQIGFIAQEAEKIFPEVVTEDKNGMKSMVYSNLVAPIVEAIKELFIQSKDQQQEIDQLKATVEAQGKALKEMQDLLCRQDPQASICIR